MVKRKKEETFNVKNLYIVRPCEFKISEDKQHVICDNENVTIGYTVVREYVYWFDDVLTSERYVSIKNPCIAYFSGKYAVIDKIPLYTKLKDSKKTTITRSEIIDLLKLMNYQEYTDIIFRQIYELSEKIKVSNNLERRKKIELINNLRDIATSYVDELNSIIGSYQNDTSYKDEAVIQLQNKYMKQLIDINKFVSEGIIITDEYKSLMKRLKNKFN